MKGGAKIEVVLKRFWCIFGKFMLHQVANHAYTHKTKRDLIKELCHF